MQGAADRSKNQRNVTTWLRRLRPRLNTDADGLNIIALSKKKQRINPSRRVEIKRKRSERLSTITKEINTSDDTILTSRKHHLNKKVTWSGGDVGMLVLSHKRNIILTRSRTIKTGHDSLENPDPTKKYKNNDSDCHKVRKLKELDRHLKLVHVTPNVSKTRMDNKTPSKQESTPSARRRNQSFNNKLADFECTPKLGSVLEQRRVPLLRSCNKQAAPPPETPSNPSVKVRRKLFSSENESHLKTKSKRGRPRIIRTHNEVLISSLDVEPLKFDMPIIPRTFLKTPPSAGPSNSSASQSSQSQSQILYCDFLSESLSHQSCPPTQRDATKIIRRRVFVNSQASQNQNQSPVSNKSPCQGIYDEFISQHLSQQKSKKIYELIIIE